MPDGGIPPPTTKAAFSVTTSQLELVLVQVDAAGREIDVHAGNEVAVSNAIALGNNPTNFKAKFAGIEGVQSLNFG